MLKTFLAVCLLIPVYACKPVATEGTGLRGSTTPSVTPSPQRLTRLPTDTSPSETMETEITGLQMISSRTDDLGFRHVSYRQYFRGIPVWQSEIIMHINKEGKTYRVDGDLVAVPENFSISSNISKSQSTELAIKHLDAGKWRISEQELMIFFNSDQPMLIWHMRANQGLQRKFILLDANSGKVVKVLEGNWS